MRTITIIIAVLMFAGITNAQERGYIEPIFQYAETHDLDEYDHDNNWTRDIKPITKGIGLNIFVPVENGPAVKIGFIYKTTDLKITIFDNWNKTLPAHYNSFEFNVGIRFYHDWRR